MPSNTVSAFHFDELDADLQNRFLAEFDTKVSTEQSGDHGHKYAAVNYADLLKQAKIGLAAAATVYNTIGQFVPSKYDMMIKIALGAVTAAVNAVPVS